MPRNQDTEKEITLNNLEDKISDLEKKVTVMTEQIESYKKKIAHLEISDDRGHKNLSEAQDYWHQQFSEALKEDSATSSNHLKEIMNYNKKSN